MTDCIRLLRHRFRHLELGDRDRRRPGRGANAPGRARARPADDADRRVLRRRRRPARAAELRVRPGRGRRLRRRHRRPADALDEEHPRQLADRAEHRHRRRPGRALSRRRRHLPRPPQAQRRGRSRRRDRPRGARPAGVLRRRRSRARRPGRAGVAQRRRASRLCEVEFQYEPIAAAFDYEQQVRGEEKVLVADIGGGTSDFSIVRVGPARAARPERKSDILANHGVHVAGTDFDRRVELQSVLPLFGYRSYGVASAEQSAREVPSAVYFDLATWHLINTVYSPARVAELRGMRSFYADPAQHRRLMSVVDHASATSCWPVPRPPRSPSPRAAPRPSTSTRSRPACERASTRPAQERRSAPISNGSSPRRARPRSLPASLPTRSTPSTSPAARPAWACSPSGWSRRFPQPGRCAATVSRASPAASRCMRRALRRPSF